MYALNPETLTLPTSAITNPAFPYDARVESARAFLASRGITGARPLYGARAKPLSLNDRLGARIDAPFGMRRAANDDARDDPRRDPSAA